MIEPKYDGVSQQFYGDYAIVYSDSKGTWGRDYSVINKKGEEKLKAKNGSGIDQLSEYGVWVVDSKLYDDNFKQVTPDNITVDYMDYGYLSFNNIQDGTSGIIDTKGAVKYSYKLQGDESFVSFNLDTKDDSLKGVYGVVSVYGEKDAIINFETGKVVYDFVNKTISTDGNNIFSVVNDDNEKENIKVYIENDKVAYQTDPGADIDLEFYSIGDRILQIDYGYMSYYSDNYDPDYEQYKYYDLDTQKLTVETPITSSSANISEFETLTGYQEINCGSKEGMIKGDKVVVPCEYNSTSYLPIDTFKYLRLKLGKDLVLFNKEDDTVLVNLGNKEVVQAFKSKDLDTTNSSIFVSPSLDDGKWVVVYNLLTNKSFEIPNSADATVYMYSNYFTSKKNGVKTYYNSDFKEIYKDNSGA